MSKKIIIFGIGILVLLGVVLVMWNVPLGERQNAITACTMEALICPDGTAVGRSGPECTFSACPQQEFFEGELVMQGDAFRLVVPAPDSVSYEVTYALPVEFGQTISGVEQFVGKRVRVTGVFTEGSRLSVETIEDISEAGGAVIERVRVGDSKLIGWVRVTLNSVVQDSRCPIDMECEEGGAIVANVTLESDTDSETRNFPSDEAPYTFDAYRISIVNVAPARLSFEEISPESYIVSFRVEPISDTN